MISRPDGILPAYLEPLRKVLDLGPATLCPGHGLQITERPSVAHYYLDCAPAVVNTFLFRRGQPKSCSTEGEVCR